MKHPIHRVTSYKVVGKYVLLVGFDDGASQVIDFEPMLKGEVYGQLRKRSVFEQVRIDPDIHTLTWPNGADFDPAILHDWPKRAGAMKAMAMRWSSDAVESPNQESAT